MMKLDNATFKLTDRGAFGSRALIVGVIGLAASAAGYFTDSGQFFHSYLTAFVFWVSLALGALFFTMLHHLTGATWSVALRRLSESVMLILPLMALFFIPIAFGIRDLFEWSHVDVVAGDHLLQTKEPFLNVTFFLARAALYFIIWFLLTRALYRLSLMQDSTGDESLYTRMRQVSAPGMVLFAFTLTFAAFDWLMSLSPHWYSTIFGVYVFVGSLLAALSFMTLMALYLRGKGVLSDKITVEHYHDLGKLLFAFMVFWTYIAFSQYFLIWYGNIPEETFWFHERWRGSWKVITLLIVFGHFCLPFMALVTRAAKRNLKLMAVVGFWMLFIHWVDLYWIVVPNLGGHGSVQPGFHLSWMDLTTMVGIGGVFLWMFWGRFTARPIVPVNDSKLEASFNFING
ncbi:MAG: hypothetical protein ACE5GA_09060 [Candidatus Zixiibacteriota bacterium]